jgi:hypothetical protein
VASWGTPDQTYSMANGSKSIRYARIGSVYIPGMTTTQPITTTTNGAVYGANGGQANYSATSTTYVQQQQPGFNIEMNCTTDFLIDDHGTISKWRFQGNNCKARNK